MRLRRYLYTASLGVLLWFVWLGVMNYPLFFFVKSDAHIAMSLATSLLAATICGVWIVDGFEQWSRGTFPADNMRATLTRMSIGIASGVVFCIPLRRILSSITNAPFGYFDALFSYGMVAIGSVWLATQIVDLFIHQRA
jgi:hypothetical protein